MNMDGIDVFVEVVDARNFALAARRLKMPPATVSAQIARLEKRLGVTLIQRTTRQFHVTEAGIAYYQYCVDAVARMREAEQALRAAAREPSGRLRLTAPPDLAQSTVPLLIDRYLARYPAVSIDLVVTNRRLDLFAEEIDIAIRAGVMEDVRLVARELMSEKLSLWASRPYVAEHGVPKTGKELQRHAFIAFSVKLPTLFQIRSEDKVLQLPDPPRIACDDLATVREFIVRGSGIGILPGHIGRACDLVPVLPSYSSSPGNVYLVYASQRYVSVKVRTFVDTALNQEMA